MDVLIALIENYGLWAVFIAALLDQGGAPVPAWPLLIVAGAMTVQAGGGLWPILLVATLASVSADLLWYGAGRHFGGAMLRLICRLSQSHESCVGNTQGIYSRWGFASLIVTKFVPGVSALATAMAGQTRISLVRFVLYDGIGAVLWAGAAVTIGAIFHEAVRSILAQLESYGQAALWVLVAAIAIFVLCKFWRRRRILRLQRVVR